MAISIPPGEPYEVLSLIEAARNAQQLRLRQSIAALEAAKIQYALIGGQATAAWVTSAGLGGERSTFNIDLLINRTDLAGACTALSVLGFHQNASIAATSSSSRARRTNPSMESS